MDIKSSIYADVMKKTDNGMNIPYSEKNGIKVPKVTVFEDIILRNLGNLDTVALEINNTKLTYRKFILEVEKYMKSFINMGIKEGDVVSLCMPVCIEFICSYYALTALGITCNALNIMFLLSEGVYAYLDERCSDTFICDEDYLKLLISKDAFNGSKIKTLIVSGDSTYTHFKGDSEHFEIPILNISGIQILTFGDFLANSYTYINICVAQYDENRISTLNYTSGTTGKAKCIGHSDLAPLFLIASHDSIVRNEYQGDRSLLTIPLQHPTGLFYAMVFQMAQGKTLVLEPRYDKTLFSNDIKTLDINHAVQAKPFYAQIIQDRANGKLKPGDFSQFRHPYSGGESIPLAVCQKINDTLQYAGCPTSLNLGYGRSEEGSLTIAPYNITGRENTAGIPLPGIEAQLIDVQTFTKKPFIEGMRGEILINSPVMPIQHCYLNPYNKCGETDNSIVDKNNIRWSRPGDIAEIVRCIDGSLSYRILGRATDYVKKGEKIYYLFDLKEKINAIKGVQECEVLCIKGNPNNFITVHIVLSITEMVYQKDVIKEIYNISEDIDGVKFYDSFSINATSGKCDRESMSSDLDDYYVYKDGQISKLALH